MTTAQVAAVPAGTLPAGAIKINVKIDPKQASAMLRQIIAEEKIPWTPELNEQWVNTMEYLMWKAPGFRHIFIKLLSAADGKPVLTRTCPIAATDGKRILVNPDTFFKQKLKQRAYVTAHEISHNIYDDVSTLHRCVATEKVPMNDGTSLPFRPHLFQAAMDYRINDMLTDSGIGEIPTKWDDNGKPVQCGLLDKSIGTCADSVFDIYKKLFEEEEKDKKNGKGGASPQGFDIVLLPGTSTDQNSTTAAAERDGQQWALEITTARTLEQMRDQGKMPGALSRMFGDVLEPKVPWYEHLRTIFARKVGTGNYNWRKGDRRYIGQDIYLPSRAGVQAGWIAIWGDTSGSISEAEFVKYLGELKGIIEDANPRRLTVYWCDHRVHQVDELEDAQDIDNLKARGVKDGGGGTSVEPVFAAIAEELEQPEVFIGFTDGYVSFPERPPYHVIWASITAMEYPWGDVVRINP